MLRTLDEIFNPAEVDTDELRDWKTLLQETLQADGLRPTYRVISKQDRPTGPIYFQGPLKERKSPPVKAAP